MKQIISILSISTSLALLIGCAKHELNTLTSTEAESGWELLFDGTSLNGWRGYMGANMEGAWSVVDGAMVLKGGSTKEGYANIITERQFKDFDLRFEWKIEPGSNSGVIFHVQEGPKMPYLTRVPQLG